MPYSSEPLRDDWAAYLGSPQAIPGAQPLNRVQQATGDNATSNHHPPMDVSSSESLLFLAREMAKLVLSILLSLIAGALEVVLTHARDLVSPQY